MMFRSNKGEELFGLGLKAPMHINCMCARLCACVSESVPAAYVCVCGGGGQACVLSE
jgi:hypothetical protein